MSWLRVIFAAAFLLAYLAKPTGGFAQDAGLGLPIYGFENTQHDQEQAEEKSPRRDDAVVGPGASPQKSDYEKNSKSDVFGSQLFTGAFAGQAASTFNADYAISVGDKIDIRLWGAYTFQSTLQVDPQGNIFLPNVGPILLRGVRNGDLQMVVEQSVRSVFRTNVFVYANLTQAQPVRIFVAGFVNRPGAYAGTSLDSVLHYLDKAGGVDPERGSFIDIAIKRGSHTRATINLYDFLLSGTTPQVQIADGDVIFVNQRQNTMLVQGLAENPRRFEFSPEAISLAQVISYAKPLSGATHVRVTRSAGTVSNVEYYPLQDAQQVLLRDGDVVHFTADKRPGTITVRVEGEHEGSQEFVLPYGSRLGNLLSKITYSARSAPENLHLLRLSVQQRQKETLNTALSQLEQTALTARSGTAEEAVLRKNEAELILRFVDRARKVEPRGQVVLSDKKGREDLLLENGDTIKIPVRDSLVLVSGGVLFPQATVYNSKLRISDYIRQAGGYAGQKAGTRVIISKPNGSYINADENSRIKVNAGDEIMILPKVQAKNRQIIKELTQILYQIAVSAGVVLGL